MNTAEPIFGRMIPAMVTPFDDKLGLDVSRTRNLVDFLIDGGSDSILVCGTTGESPTLTTAEKLLLFETVIDQAAGRVPVIANVGSNNTAGSIELGLEAKKLGAQGIMAVVPYYNKPPQEGLYQHFKAIAEEVDLPTVLYNIPGRCSLNMTAETTLRLANDVKQIVYVKEASGDIDQIAEICEGAPEGFWVLSGDDSMTLPLMEKGGHGVISTAGNVMPKEMKELVDLCAAGDWDAARAAHEALMPIMKGLFVVTNPILTKQALNLIGVPVGGLRLPLIEATAQQTRDLEDVLKEVGAL
ncbi:MAG: 4-hydroxy-tetrahydrodipicolinate synthase [Eggerthellaceae bacterium]|nr:4-hydroxy-tetrahydrodipicolinate synthase [Eggerthellaceae bacterium]